MAVVTKYSKGHPGYAVGAQPKAINKACHAIVMSNDIAIANGDSALSKLYFGKIPSHARILPQSALWHTAVSGVTDFDIGLEYGSSIDGDCLADGLNISAAGSKNVVAAVTTDNLTKAMWQLLGLASDPGAEFDVVGQIKADATANGTVAMSLFYVDGR